MARPTSRWRRVLGWTAPVVLVLVLLGLFGPRVAIVEPTGPVGVPAEVESWLALREEAVPGLVPGTEKVVRWVDPKRRRPTELAVVYVHGFSATRHEVAPLFDDVARTLGANLFYTRLRGHGRDGEALAEAEVEDWLEDVLEAYEIGKRLGRRVIVAGSGTGAAAAVWLAARRADDALHALVLLSPSFAPRRKGWRILLQPWGGLLAHVAYGSTAGFEPDSDDHARWWTERYPIEALLPEAGLMKLVSGVMATEVGVPVLGFVSPRDQVVDAALAHARLASFPNPANVVFTVTNSGDRRHHVLAGDVLSPSTTDTLTTQVLAFLDSLPSER